MWPAARSPANRASVGKPGPSREQGRPRRTPARKTDRRTGQVPPNVALLPPASRFESQSFVFSEAGERERMLGLQRKIGFLGLVLRREEAKAPLSHVPFPHSRTKLGAQPSPSCSCFCRHCRLPACQCHARADGAQPPEPLRTLFDVILRTFRKKMKRGR